MSLEAAARPADVSLVLNPNSRLVRHLTESHVRSCRLIPSREHGLNQNLFRHLRCLLEVDSAPDAQPLAHFSHVHVWKNCSKPPERFGRRTSCVHLAKSLKHSRQRSPQTYQFAWKLRVPATQAPRLGRDRPTWKGAATMPYYALHSRNFLRAS